MDARNYADVTIFTHGPQGCGKSAHAARLAKRYGKPFIIEHNSSIHPDKYPVDALVLTNDPLPGSIPFDAAMSAAGLAIENATGAA